MVAGVGVFSSCFFILPYARAAERSYSYDSIVYEIKVNRDTTVDITERQIFNYVGNYHAATRDISLQKLNAITDIQVIDGATGQPFEYSRWRLNKLDPTSWGKFTYYLSTTGGREVEWYYNLADTTHEWIIKYRAHGALAFYRDHDELYWNLLTAYEAPIKQVSATIFLPENNFPLSVFRLTPYSSLVESRALIQDNRTFYAGAQDVPPYGQVTFALGWPKGLVTESAFWSKWLKSNWGNLLAILTVVIGFLFGFLFWLKKEKLNQGRGAIVPQYSPPEKLKPAMAEVIIKEKITSRAWPATIIDLAVRGHLKIIEERGWFRHDYRLQKMITNSAENDLEDYEREFLDILFSDRETFSTKELRRGGAKVRQKLSRNLIHLREKLYKETALDTKAYEVGPAGEYRFDLMVVGSAIATFALFGFSRSLAVIFPTIYQLVIFLWAIFITYFLLRSFIKYEARLSRGGADS